MRKAKNFLGKILFSVMISIMIIVTSNTSVLAANISTSENIPTLQEMKNYLLSIGTEQEFLNKIDDSRIERLYWTCAGKEVSFAGYETEIVEIQDSDPRLRGQISTSQLSLGVAIYEFTSGGKVTGLSVSTTYEWLSNPILYWTDAHTFTFDGTKFKVGGIYAESGYQIDNQWFLIDSVDTPATAADGGLGWYLSTARGDIPNRFHNRGGADIYLIPRNGSATRSQLSSSMYYTYAHQIVGTSISLSPNGGSVSISGGSYDFQTKIYNY